MTFTRIPSATIFFKAPKNMAFNHFLLGGRMACINFLMAMKDEPVWSLSPVMVVTIPALQDTMMIASNYTVIRLTKRDQVRKAYTSQPS